MILVSLPIASFVEITVTIRCQQEHQTRATEELSRILLYFTPQWFFRTNVNFSNTPSHQMTHHRYEFDIENFATLFTLIPGALAQEHQDWWRD